MMRVLQINIVYGHGSTGVIAKLIADVIMANGDEPFCAYDGSDSTLYKNGYPIGNKWSYRIHAHIFTKYLDREGFGSYYATKRLCKWMDGVKPDVIHLHNIHGSYINVPLLFEYINKWHIPVVMTLHDCWTMTGHCFHFESVVCERWVDGCHHCPLHKTYPVSLGPDRSKKNYILKKSIFTSVEKMHVVSVSKFIDNIVSRSYLGKYPHSVVYNGVDIDVFKPRLTEPKDKLCSSDKKIVLGVSSGWNNQKGLQEMISLSQDSYLQVVMVGVQESLIEQLPKEIIAIGRTESQNKLAELYSLADVFVNPTYNDSFPTVNIEALACGTPVVTYRTGGSPEAVDDMTGIVVKQGDKRALLDAVRDLANKSGDTLADACRRRAEKMFNKDRCYSSYISIYDRLYEESMDPSK